MRNRAVVMTISDRCAAGQAVDRSGPVLVDQLVALDADVVHREVLPDEIERIRRAVSTWIDRCDLILTTGGTGIAERDVTPEAVSPLIQRMLPGFGEVMRLRAFDRTPMSILSRSGAGISGKTLIIWLPGAPRAVSECMEWLTPAIGHVCAFLRGERPH